MPAAKHLLSVQVPFDDRSSTQSLETMNRMEKKRENAEEKQGKPPKEKKTPGRETPQSDRYWYDPDCGPIYPD